MCAIVCVLFMRPHFIHHKICHHTTYITDKGGLHNIVSMRVSDVFWAGLSPFSSQIGGHWPHSRANIQLRCGGECGGTREWICHPMHTYRWGFGGAKHERTERCADLTISSLVYAKPRQRLRSPVFASCYMHYGLWPQVSINFSV